MEWCGSGRRAADFAMRGGLHGTSFRRLAANRRRSRRRHLSLQGKPPLQGAAGDVGRLADDRRGGGRRLAARGVGAEQRQPRDALHPQGAHGRDEADGDHLPRCRPGRRRRADLARARCRRTGHRRRCRPRRKHARFPVEALPRLQVQIPVPRRRHHPPQFGPLWRVRDDLRGAAVRLRQGLSQRTGGAAGRRKLRKAGRADQGCGQPTLLPGRPAATPCRHRAPVRPGRRHRLVFLPAHHAQRAGKPQHPRHRDAVDRARNQGGRAGMDAGLRALRRPALRDRGAGAAGGVRHWRQATAAQVQQLRRHQERPFRAAAAALRRLQGVLRRRPQRSGRTISAERLCRPRPLPRSRNTGKRRDDRSRCGLVPLRDHEILPPRLERRHRRIHQRGVPGRLRRVVGRRRDLCAPAARPSRAAGQARPRPLAGDPVDRTAAFDPRRREGGGGAGSDSRGPRPARQSERCLARQDLRRHLGAWRLERRRLRRDLPQDRRRAADHRLPHRAPEPDAQMVHLRIRAGRRRPASLDRRNCRLPELTGRAPA